MGQKMTTHNNNLVIVCEGTDTEYQYFTEMKDYLSEHYPDKFCVIKVVPAPEEKIRKKNPRRSQMTRQLEDAPQYHYYCKYEQSAEDYERYRAQPTRYVREAALFMKENGFVEGWAVFDCDKHPAHQFAFDYAVEDNVKIAFSSYSFEEWLLAHFERCPRAFLHSECKVGEKEQKCGGRDALSANCGGTDCLGGYLRAHSYIADYSKSKHGLFQEYTLPRIRQAMINAAWMRQLSEEPIYSRNPYTDVDLLVAHLIGITETYQWYRQGMSFRFASSMFNVLEEEGNVVISNNGDVAILIGTDQVFFIDSHLTETPCSEKTILYPGGVLRFGKPEGAIALKFVDGYRNSLVEL